MSSAPQQQEPFPRIIRPDVARITIIVYAFSILIAFVTCITIFPKAFPELYVAVVGKLPPTPKDDRRRPRAGRASLVRTRLLFTAALMSMGDAINNIIMVQSADSTGSAHFVAYHLLRGVTFLTAGPLFVMAMASRIAVIVVMQQQWKTWFLRSVYAFTIYIMLQQQVVLIMGVVQRLGSSPATWIDASMWPFWTTGPMALLPVFSIGGSLAALRIAFKSPSVTTISLHSHSESSGSSSHSQPHAGKPVANVEDRASTLKYPLTRAFSILGCSLKPFLLHYLPVSLTFSPLHVLSQNIIMVILWIAFIVCALVQNSPFVVRISSLSDILTSLAIFTETSFEWLLKHSQKKRKELKISSRKLKEQQQQQQQKSQASIAASKHLSEHETWKSAEIQVSEDPGVISRKERAS